MSPLAIILKAELTPLDEWVTVNHMAVPFMIFYFIQSFRFEKGLMKGAQYLLDFVTPYFKEFVFDPDTSDDGVQKIFYEYYVKVIPLYENQEGYWRFSTGRKRLEHKTRY